MNETIHLGAVTWHWATNVVCAGPDERLIILRGRGSSPVDAADALASATKMEWRDAGFRKWRIQHADGGVTFISHYERLGPVPLGPEERLAALTSERLEGLLAIARETGRGDGTRLRPRA